MAVRYSIASGNWTDAARWGLVDSTSYLNSEDSGQSLVTAYSSSRSSAFTPGAITVSHLAVKLRLRSTTTGTMSVSLRNATIGLDDFVTGTEVTINTSDLPAAASADLNGGWIVFKLASPVLLLAATNYNIQAKVSSANSVDLTRDATSGNISRCLVTTTTGAPAATDDLIIAEERTGAGTFNAFTVTMNETASTDYGSGASSLVTPAIAICDGGTLQWGTTAATAYQLKVSGNVIVYSGGTYNMGTTGTPCPRDSTMELILDCVTNVEFGLVIRNLGTCNIQGQSRSSGKNVVTCKLNTDEAANSTSLGVDTDTGWPDNDEIAVASTTQTASQTEAGTLNGNAGASTLTVDGFAGTGGGLLNAHGGTAPICAEVILLTRNVIIRGVSTTVQAYFNVAATAVVDCDWARFKWLGSATANKRGIDIATITGSVSFDYCSFDNWVVASSGIVVTGATSDNYFLRNCVWFNTNTSFTNIATSGTTWTCDNLIAMGATGTGVTFTFADAGGTITNITSAGNNSSGGRIAVSDLASPGTVNGLTAHSNAAGQGITIGFLRNGTISNLTSWRSGAAGGMNFQSLSNVIVDGITAFGNSNNNIFVSTNLNLTLKNVVASADATFATPTGIITAASTIGGEVFVEDSTFGVASGIKTAHATQDVNIQAGALSRFFFHNTLMASATEVGLQSSMFPCALVSSQKHDQTSGSHRTWKREGTLSTDAVIFDSSPSLRMTPLFATEKLTSDGITPIFSAAVANGGTLTVSVKVRESVVGDGTDYNGNRIRLIVKRNAAAGIAADTVLATATASSVGAWETLSGTTAAVTDNAILEFMVDCDGTTGWVNVDTWTVTPVADTLGLAYWSNGVPRSYGNNSSGGGGGMIGGGNLSGGFQ